MDDLRELDRQIAELLGWHPVQRGEGWAWFKGDISYTAPESMYGTAEGVFDFLYDNHVLWHYSTDLSAAIELVGDHYFTLNQNPQMEIDFQRWEAQIGLRSTWGRGETPALAICHAWLAYTQHKQPAAPA